jgi:hypothetical protein
MKRSELSDVIVDAAVFATNIVKKEISKNGNTLKQPGNYYQISLSYLIEAGVWSLYKRKLHVMETILRNVKKSEDVLELGCASGITGIALLNLGYNVAFSDFSGAPEIVIKEAAPDRFFAYGDEPVSDWVIALDVIEHVANPLSFIRWIYNQCTIGAIITYPILEHWQPPYQQLEVDNYIDTELLIPSIKKLFRIQYMKVIDGGYEMVLRKK